jgi:hypothetical protein
MDQRLRRVLLAAALLVSLGVLAWSWQLPILEMHSFRQTQTAVSAYWMGKSSHWLAYPTPVAGPPWSIPFELPLFQGLVVMVAAIVPINLDQAGRLVSWLMALATLWPLRRAIMEIDGSRRLADFASFLFLLSPLYLFWSRAFLIESTALFFAVGYVAIAATWLRTRAPRTAWLLAGCAVLGALVKITTFFSGALAAAMLLLVHLHGMRRQWNWREAWRTCWPVAAGIVLALVATKAWLVFSDIEKSKTLWGSVLLSTNLDAWNFGTLAQKLDMDQWRHVAGGRAARDILGSARLLPVAVLLALLAPARRRLFAFAALGLYLVPFAVFTNLHWVHNYYQYANGIFLVVMLACAIEGLRERFGEGTSLAVLVLAGVLMLLGFGRDFAPAILDPQPHPQTIELAANARAHTKPDEVLLIFGMDWTSEVPYYAARRAMMVPDFVTAEQLQRMASDPASISGEYHVGMVIDCPNRLRDQPGTRAAFAQLMARQTAGRTATGLRGCVVWN